MDDKNDAPLVEGGQGRSGDAVQGDAVVWGCCVLLCAVLAAWARCA